MMGARAVLLDSAGVEAIAAPDDSLSRVALDFAMAARDAGLPALVDNASGEIRLLRVSDTEEERLLPVVVPPTRRGARSVADVVSPYSHFVDYSREEIGKSHPGLPEPLLAVAMAPLAAAIVAGRCEAVVYLNNLLLATNPRLALSEPSLAVATAELTRHFPDRAIVVRSASPVLAPHGVAQLRAVGYRLVRGRRVFVVDPRVEAKRRTRSNVKADRGLSRRTGYEVVDDPLEFNPGAARLVELYRSLYIGKHSRLNPSYTGQFLQILLRSEMFAARGIVRHGRLDGFVLWHVLDGVMVSNLLGYDLSMPRSVGLYRQLFAILIGESKRLGLPLNMSAGAESFKRLRGGVPSDEYDAVYDRHLPAWRRAGWRLVAAAADAGALRTHER
jgi:hypothetical protein